MAEKRINTEELSHGKVESYDLPMTGSIAEMNFSENFEITSEINLTRLELEKFMEEEVTVIVQEPSNPDEPLLLTTCVNGRAQVFFKGKEQKVKRKFIEVLARAKRTHIKTPEILDSDGNRTTRITKTPRLEHPFQVIYDPNPRGKIWLQAIAAES